MTTGILTKEKLKLRCSNKDHWAVKLIEEGRDGFSLDVELVSLLSSLLNDVRSPYNIQCSLGCSKVEIRYRIDPGRAIPQGNRDVDVAPFPLGDVFGVDVSRSWRLTGLSTQSCVFLLAVRPGVSDSLISPVRVVLL